MNMYDIKLSARNYIERLVYQEKRRNITLHHGGLRRRIIARTKFKEKRNTNHSNQ